ncbi:MAG: hypothetical protein EOO20_01820 [Chryseobacterium sp.]|nr:MAG: hypothetical protein EOO20_01820 [Chryseobacterium sp.]
MKATRDDFKQNSEKALGGRVAYRCSYLVCRIITIGSDTENEEKVVSFWESGTYSCGSVRPPAIFPGYDVAENINKWLFPMLTSSPAYRRYQAIVIQSSDSL